MNAGALVPKIIGADIEVGNFILRPESNGEKTAPEAVARLLAELPGVPAFAHARGVNLLDRERRYFPATGGCAYNDSDHCELALPETADALQHVEVWHAALRQLRAAQAAANARLGDGGQLRVHISNSDGLGHSYGGHQNYTVTRRAFLRTLRDPVALAHLASFQAALAVLVGQGKVGGEGGEPHVDYQLSQRADFMCVLVSADTMINRSLVNSRDESHAAPELARQHVICFDSTLNEVGRFVNVGAMQLELCLIEAGDLAPALMLERPIDAMQAWSRDPALRVSQPLALGGATSMVDLLQRFHDAMARLVARGTCAEAVPHAELILTHFATLLDLAAARDFAGLARRVDWAAKLALLNLAARECQLEWASPEMKRLDHQWSSLDDGFHWDALASGASERLLAEDDPTPKAPETTRAYTRARLLQLAPRGSVQQIDWEDLTFHLRRKPGARSRRVRVSLATPFGFGKEGTGLAHVATLEEALDILAQQPGTVEELPAPREFLAPLPPVHPPIVFPFQTPPHPHS